jgi:amino acid adenylation domain-containing protein
MEDMNDRLAELSPEKRKLLEALLRKKRAQAATTAAIPPRASRGQTGDVLPLSFSQERLWLIDQFEPDSPAYNISSALRFTGELDVEALRRSLDAIRRRHESLRTRFEVRDGGPAQVIDPPSPFVLPLIDLAGLPADRREEEALRLARRDADRPFDLRRGPVFRAVLVRVSRREHVLLSAMHHIVSDGWSLGIFGHELGLLYPALAAGRPDPLPPLPIQYGDFALWQRHTLDGPVLEAQLDFWRRRLAGLEPVLELPADRPRPARRNPAGGFHAWSLPSGLVRELRALGGQSGTTLFTTLLAGFLALLHRQTQRDDLCVGSPVAGRRQVETEGLIGFFVNTLVLRADLAGEPTFRELLARVHEVQLDAQGHQDVPFDRLVSELATERSLAYTPIFQVLFALQNASNPSLRLPGLEVDGINLPAANTKFDLSLLLRDAGEAVAGGMEYSLDLFDPPTIDRLLAGLTALFAGMVARPEARVSEVPLLSPAERHQLLEEWGAGPWSEPLPLGGACLHELIAAQAERAPDAVALVHGTHVLTYRELAGRAGGIARRLRGLGAGPEVRVAVCLERSPDLIAALIGVLAAGAAYVPVDPAYPAERQRYMVEDSGAAVLVTRGALASGPVVLDLGAEEIPDAPWPADTGVGQGNLAYVIYTSGSTGRPKGVAIEHRSAVTLADWSRREFSAEELSGVLVSTSVCFDVSVFEIFMPLAWGGRLILAGNALDLPALPAASEVRVATMVPSAAAELARARAIPPGVRVVGLGGEPVPAVLAERLYAPGTVRRVLNMYGPSEDTTYSTVALVPPKGERAPSIGRPVLGARAYVVDRHGGLVQPGVPGELWMAGAGISRGYLGRPALTAERYVPDPFSGAEGGAPGSRAYRTGDLARFRPDGELEYLGRIDHQVKIRGFRVELGEIEETLRSHPAARDCVVVAREDTPGQRRLVAYLEGPPVDAAELRAHLGRRLPEHMIPSLFVSLEALPRTPNGKVDRRSLPAPDASRAGDDSYAPPSDPTEELLAGFWAEVLGLDRVGVNDNFFALGGHSLLATQVISRVREVMAVELPQRTIFEAPTVAEMARAVRAVWEAAQEGPAAPPIAHVPRDGDLPLSFAQQRFWFLDQLEPGNPAYNIPSAVRLSGELPPGLLERIFAELTRRHEALRTTFPSREGQPVQVIVPELEPEIPVLDLAGLPAAEREARARRLALEEALRPFDLARGPLLRLALLRLAEREHVLLMTMHHIVSDGWSMGVLLREVGALYAGSPLRPLPLQYADFAAWQRGWMRDEVLEAEMAGWRQRLEGAPRLLELPTDRPRPAVQTYNGAAVVRRLAPATSAALRDLCRREGVTPFMALLAAWSALLGRQSGQREVLVGTPVAGRNRRELEGLIGCFVNTLVMRSDLGGEPTFGELLARTRATALDAYAHQDLPFERIVEELVPERDLSHPPLFQALLVLQNTPRRELELPGLTLAPLEVESRVARVDLTLSFQEDAGGFAAALEHNSDLFDPATAVRLLARFEALLGAAAGDPGLSLAELPALLPAERHQALVEWNDTARGYATGVTLHELIARQTARTPDTVAASFEGEALTYRELERRANRLAHQLIAFGVRPDGRVGVLMERSLEMIVALLGVLKAGAAYVPLDPTYPAERLAVLIEGSGALAVIAQGRLTHLLPGYAGRTLLLDRGWDGAGGPDTAPEAAVDEGNLAYVLFTSGSTGTPKGVMIPHRGIVNRLLWMQEAYGLAPDDRVLQKTPFSFDVSLWEFFWPLLAGARLVFARPEGHRDPAYLADLIAREGITTLHFVPSMLQAFLEAPEASGLPSLRRVMASGEALPPELARRFYSKIARAGLHNLYGPTEASVDVSFWPCDPDPARAVVPIGRPIANLRLHVVDPGLRLQPVGVAGELLLGGVGLARGYMGRPDLTAASFVPDPFAEVPGERLYRTGDLVRALPDGNVEFLGRIDHQVKIRGFRIELGEIEAVLASHPGVRECVVVAREDVPGSRYLAAYLAGDAKADDLRAHLARRLPEYMVPSVFVALEALPLSPNGKVDRKALPVPTLARREEEIVAPRTPTEEALAAIWKELLNLERVGVEDRFFELGGHSLLATQVLARVKQTFGVEISLHEVFRTPTIAGLAALVDARAVEPTDDDDLAALLDELDLLSDEEAKERVEDLR